MNRQSVLFPLLKLCTLLAVIFIAGYTSTLGSIRTINVVRSNSSEMVLSISPEFEGFERIATTGGAEAWRAKFKEAGIEAVAPGAPALPVIKFNFAVPSTDGFTIADIKVENGESFNRLLAPKPALIKDGDFASESYTVNSELYSNFKNLPVATAKYAGIARSNYLATLTICPLSYNVANDKITLAKKITVTIKFNTPKSFKESIASGADNSMVDVLNPGMVSRWQIPSVGKLSSKNNLNPSIQSAGADWIKIKLTDEGIYKIDASQLSALGVNITSDLAKTIKIFGIGGKVLSEKVSDAPSNIMNEQAIIVKTKQNGEFESLVFYGSGVRGFDLKSNKIERYINHYSTSSNYMLTWGGQPGQRAVELPAPEAEATYQPETYKSRICFEEDLNNAYTNGSGRVWFGRTYFTSPFMDLLPDLDRNDTILYRFKVAHRSTTDGIFTSMIGQDTLANMRLSRIGSYIHADRTGAEAKYPASKIPGDGRSILKFNYSSGTNSAGTGFLDYYEIHYPRYFKALKNELGFIQEPNQNGVAQYKINGFSGDIIGFDCSDLRNPKLLKNISSTGGMYIFKTTLDQTKISKFYISGDLKTPKLEKAEIQNLRDPSNNADMIVITNNSFLGSANKFAEYRSQESGMKLLVTTTEMIYNEFSGGSADITSIRDFLAYTYANWQTKPKFVMLWGDGHYDYRSLQSKISNYVPVYEDPDENLESFDETSDAFATDDFYALINGDDPIMDVAIGRVTIDSPDAGDKFLDKIKHYETASSKDSWRTWATFVADDGPAAQTYPPGYDGALHVGGAERLANGPIPDDMQVKKIYLVEYPWENIPSGVRKPKVTEDLLSFINTNSSLFLHWQGHGNPRVWAHEEILNRDIHIPMMKNYDKLFFLVASTCDYGRMDNPDLRSGSEEMALSKVGGAIGVISATRVVYPSESEALASKFYSKVIGREIGTGKHLTLGEAMLAVKQTLYETNDRKYYLLGDPSMHLLLPEYTIRIDTLNNKATTDITSPLKIKGLSRVDVSASIINPVDSTLISGFNGNAILTLLDGDVRYLIQEKTKNPTDNTSMFDFVKMGGALNRSSYPVTAGKFTASFVIPKDISFSDSCGRMFVYAFSENNKFATGYTRQFQVSGVLDVSGSDKKGPKIDLFLDSKEFIKGDVVREVPLLIISLFDETGINSAGLGIGHKIEAWIDNSPTSMDLTPKFNTSLDDSRYGSAQDFLYGLAPGIHTVKVRAWDVYNNYSMNETEFRIAAAGDSYYLEGLSNYPNPIITTTKIKFRHNISPPFEATVDIYNSIGSLVKSMSLQLTSVHSSEIEWNGDDNEGASLPSGTYYYRVKVSGDKGESTSNTAGIGVIAR